VRTLFHGLSLSALLLSSPALAALPAPGGETCAAEQLFNTAFAALDCAPSAEHECDEQCKAAYQAGLDLPQLLAKSPELWPAVAPLFRARFEAGGAAKDHALYLLASSSAPAAIALGDELFRAAPKSFCELQVLALAEQGSEACARELAARQGAECSGTALSAAWLAFRGEPAGKRTLLAAAAKPVDAESLTDVLVSAAALGALGDVNAFPAAKSRVHAAVLGALDQGQLEAARTMALGAELLIESLEPQISAKSAYGKVAYSKDAYGGAQGSAKAPRTSYLPHQVAWRVKQASPKFETPDEVFELIESVIPAS
jgi:hypothetical protein